MSTGPSASAARKAMMWCSWSKASPAEAIPESCTKRAESGPASASCTPQSSVGPATISRSCSGVSCQVAASGEVIFTAWTTSCRAGSEEYSKSALNSSEAKEVTSEGSPSKEAEVATYCRRS